MAEDGPRVAARRRVTDRDFRLIVRRLGGIGLVTMEFISSRALTDPRARAKTLELMHFVDEERPLSIQIYGSDPDTMAEAARTVEERGADLCDVNMGCPANKILKGCAGARLMGDLPLALPCVNDLLPDPEVTGTLWAACDPVYRSEDGGATWRKMNDDRSLRQRAWYYSRVYAGPKDIDEVYVLNVRFWRSGDGGKTFSSISTPHGDHHDLWIAPEDPMRMIIGDDGGAQVSYDGGTTWSTYYNQPTAQFYRVTTDNAFPYRIYAAQQDNSTISVSSRVSTSPVIFLSTSSRSPCPRCNGRP